MRRHLTQLAAFGVNGAVTAGVYSAVVWTLIHLSRGTFALDVLVAYVVAAVFNYAGARLIFKQSTTPGGHVFRYLIVAGVNFAVTTGLAWLLHRENAPDAIAAYLPPLVLVIPTFALMRTWVFSGSTDGTTVSALEPVRRGAGPR